MMDTIKHTFDSLAPRTAYALIALGFVLILVVILNMGDKTAQLRAERVRLEQRLAQYGTGLDEAAWTQRAQDALNAQSRWEGFTWTGPTPGIIAAQIQSQLSAMGATYNLENVRIEVDPSAITLPSGETILRFQLAGRSREIVDLVSCLEAVTAASPGLAIDEMNVTISNRNRGALRIAGLAAIAIETVAPADTPPANGQAAAPTAQGGGAR